MKDHKFQLVRIPVERPGESVRYTGETEKSYAALRGVFVALPQSAPLYGAALSLKVGGTEIFDEEHDVRLITCSEAVAPNEKFFQLEEFIEAGGSAFEGRYRDPQMDGTQYPYEAKLFLWLHNPPQA